MDQKIRLPERFIKISCLLVCGVLCLVFLFLSIASLFSTSVIDPAQFISEHILYVPDNILLNLLIVAVLFLLFKLYRRYGKSIKTIYAIIALLGFTTFLGVLWVGSVRSVPAADSGMITRAAEAFLNGKYGPLRSADSYFRYFPFQLGFTAFVELLMRVFGTQNYVALGIVNVVFLDAAFLALILLSRLVFEDKKIEHATILLLAGCLQPILFCTFIYGNIIGLGLSLWAVVFTAYYIKNNKRYLLLFASVFIAAAIAVKPNYTIVLVAMCVMLLLHFVKTRKALALVSAVFAVALTLLCSRLAVSGYESRANVKLGKGVPQGAWLAMGLQETYMAPGWYNRYTINTFKSKKYNTEATAVQARKNIDKHLAYFKEHPQFAFDFFTKKALSQWNEPTYESIWLSQVKSHQKKVPDWVQGIYKGELGKGLQFYLNLYQQIILVGFFFAMVSSFKKPSLLFTFLPLIVLGGFLYHMAFEAKSQYILVYFVMLVPYAAYGWDAAAGWKVFNLRSKLTDGNKKGRLD